MITGVLVTESLRAGTVPDGVGLVVRAIRRTVPEHTTKDQPATWTLIEFEAADADAEPLADELAAILDQPGWYADFHSPEESFVVFSGRIFRYPRGDAAGRAEAEVYARALGVPEPQLDWPT